MKCIAIVKHIRNDDIHIDDRERNAAAKQLQSSPTCRDVVKKKTHKTVKVRPSSNLRPRWRTMEVGGGDSPE